MKKLSKSGLYVEDVDEDETSRVTFAIVLLFFLVGLPLVFGMVDEIEQAGHQALHHQACEKCTDLTTALKKLKTFQGVQITQETH